MNRKDRDLEIVNRFIEDAGYECNEATRDFIATRYPSKLLDDIWMLIAYEGMTEAEAIQKTEATLQENYEKWEGERPFSGFTALNIARSWINDTNSEQWEYPKRNDSEQLELFFKFSIEASVVKEETLKLIVNQHRSNWDLIIGEVLNRSFHISNSEKQLQTKVSAAKRIYSRMLNRGHKNHQKLCDLAIGYYDRERDKFLAWVRERHPDDHMNIGRNHQFSELKVLVGNMQGKNASGAYVESEWNDASQKCKKDMLVGWAARRQGALAIAEHHVVESEDDRSIATAKELVEAAEEALGSACLYAEYVKAIASGATLVSLPPIVRVKGKRYDRDIHPSIVLLEAENWLAEAKEQLEKLRSKKENKPTQ